MSSTEPEWPVQTLSATGTPYPWPYGARMLISERELVAHMHNLSGTFKAGHILNQYVGDHRIFTVPFAFDDAFIDSSDQRVILMDRVRTFYNFNWKRDIMTYITCNNAKGCNTMDFGPGSLFFTLKRHADDIFKKFMGNLLLLQALTEELKPETRAMAQHCTSFEQLDRCILDAGV